MKSAEEIIHYYSRMSSMCFGKNVTDQITGQFASLTANFSISTQRGSTGISSLARVINQY